MNVNKQFRIETRLIINWDKHSLWCEQLKVGSALWVVHHYSTSTSAGPYTQVHFKPLSFLLLLITRCIYCMINDTMFTRQHYSKAIIFFSRLFSLLLYQISFFSIRRCHCNYISNLYDKVTKSRNKDSRLFIKKTSNKK